MTEKHLKLEFRQKSKSSVPHKKKDNPGHTLPPLQNFDAFEKLKQLEKKLKLKKEMYRYKAAKC